MISILFIHKPSLHGHTQYTVSASTYSVTSSAGVEGTGDTSNQATSSTKEKEEEDKDIDDSSDENETTGKDGDGKWVEK